MAFDLPFELRAAVRQLIAGAGLREQASHLTATYGAGSSSASIDVAAYLAARLPATFASVSAVFGQVAHLMPDFAPETLLDIGAGPGTASLAARRFWPSLTDFHLVERDPRFARVAADLLADAKPRITQTPLQGFEGKASLVVAAYVLAELPEAEAVSAAQVLWTATGNVCIVIEPGTPQGFARTRAVREHLLKLGAHLVGPCTHDAACPMQANDWCHFKVRLQRSREHLHAKAAVVPYEDEAYSWVAFAREAVPRPRARIVAPPVDTKAGITFELCTAGQLLRETFASRDKATYKRVRKLKWGDSLDQ